MSKLLILVLFSSGCLGCDETCSDDSARCEVSRIKGEPTADDVPRELRPQNPPPGTTRVKLRGYGDHYNPIDIHAVRIVDVKVSQ